MPARRNRKDGLSYCAVQVRRYDYDRYLCTLFAPTERREGLFALYAFNAEVAKTRTAVSEPMLGEIRLQWWREAIAGIYEGEPRRHEVVQPLAAAIRRFELPRAPFDRLIDARAFDLQDDPPKTLRELERYAEDTSSTLLQSALEMFGERSDGAQAAARHLGIAWALTGLIRAAPFHARAKRQYLPADLMAAAGARPSDLFELRAGGPLKNVFKGVADAAREHLSAARSLRRAIPRTAVPAMLPAVLAGLYLEKIAKADHDVMDRSIEAGPVACQLRLTLAALRGRF